MKISWILMAFLPVSFAALLTTGCQTRAGDTAEESFLRIGIPPRAEKVAEGTDQISHQFESSGRAYLYDRGRNEVIGRFEVRKGQRLGVDARAGRAALDGNEVMTGRLRAGDAYEIYLLPIDQDENAPPAETNAQELQDSPPPRDSPPNPAGTTIRPQYGP